MKKVVSVLLTLAILATMTSAVFAQKLPDIGTKTNQKLTDAAGTVLGYVQFFGYALAIGMLLYIGIKYMMASANEKADLKKGSINFVIGAILVAAASTIVGIFKDIGGQIS